MTNFEWDIPTDDEGNLVLYAHTFASTLEPTKLANEDPLLQADTKIEVSNEPKLHNCLEAIGTSKCEVMSVLNLRDAYHTLPLAEESQKYCSLTPYYGSPTYVYLRMGMGMSCSPALWQQFVHIIWEQLPNKEIQNYYG